MYIATYIAIWLWKNKLTYLCLIVDYELTNYIEELCLLYLKELGYSLRVYNTLLVAITPLRELKIILVGVTVTNHF